MREYEELHFRRGSPLAYGLMGIACSSVFLSFSSLFIYCSSVLSTCYEVKCVGCQVSKSKYSVTSLIWTVLYEGTRIYRQCHCSPMHLIVKPVQAYSMFLKRLPVRDSYFFFQNNILILFSAKYKVLKIALVKSKFVISNFILSNGMISYRICPPKSPT